MAERRLCGGCRLLFPSVCDALSGRETWWVQGTMRKFLLGVFLI
jgi:hypothetical protein